MKPIVSVRNLGKRYQMCRQRNVAPTLREAVIGVAKSQFGRFFDRSSSKDWLWVLRDVSFDVEPGEVVGIIGSNGAGKSTLLRILARITKPSAGEADIFGRVGSLLEIGTGFHPDLTGRENIHLNAAILGMKRPEIKHKFDEIVAFSEVEEFLDTPVKFYSSGMYLRLAFSVASHLEPEVLLLDEVLAVGDFAFQQKCLAKMREVSSDGRTVFFVSHSTPAIEQLCQRVFLISAGHVTETSKEEAIAKYTENVADRSGLNSIGELPPDQADDQDNQAKASQSAQIAENDQGSVPVVRSLDWQVRKAQTSLQVSSAPSELESFDRNSRKLIPISPTKAKEVEEASAQTIAALTAELTACESQLSTILSSRGWRWVSRASRIKRRYLMPLYESIIHFRRNGHRLRVPRLAVGNIQIHQDRSKLQFSILYAKQASTPNTRPSVSYSRRADVVCFSIMDWDYQYQRPQQMMSQFAAQGHRVFYIRIGRVLSSHQQPRFALTKLKDNLYEVTLAAARPAWIHQEEIRGINADGLLLSLNELRRECNLSETMAYVMSPSWTSVAFETRRLWNWGVIYDCMDDWSGFSAVSRAVLGAEEKLARECDMLVVTSQLLRDKWSRLDREIVTARNAVDFDFYAERCAPNALLPGIKRPVVGYCGAVTDWFDVDLMTHIARERPLYTFVLLGRVETKISELESLANVRVLGRQPYETMPQYLYHFDACLIPFKLNEITRATDPIKLYEYLSAGKPVVSAALPELESLRELLYFASDKGDFLVRLDQAVAENDQTMIERRRRFASRNTWRDRYETISSSTWHRSRCLAIPESAAVPQQA